MNDARQTIINEIVKIIKKHANVSYQEKLNKMSEQILEAGINLTSLVKLDFSSKDFEKLVNSLAANSDTYVRKVISGMALAFLMGTFNFPQNTAGGLTGNFISLVYGQYESDEKSSVLKMMTDMYLVAQKKSQF